MTTVTRFEDLRIWQESMDLSVQVYKILKDCKDYGLKDQIQRSSVSIPSNIAEGFDRNYNKEFIRFLNIAKGSTAELRTQLELAKRIKIIEDLDNLIESTIEISKGIQALINYRSKF